MERKALSRDEVCIRFFDKRSDEKFDFPCIQFHLGFNERSDLFKARINRLVNRGLIKSWIDDTDTVRYYSSINYHE